MKISCVNQFNKIQFKNTTRQIRGKKTSSNESHKKPEAVFIDETYDDEVEFIIAVAAAEGW